ncbi:MAG TPA: class I SAM-dependent methyltransferase [Puia sp.]|nr:class I SAM-dependent methyltransferase [Puia sp.]
MNQLEDFFHNRNHRLIHKWNHYFEIYDRHLNYLKGRKINMLEIGIAHGGSLEMWNDYFKGNVMIYAVDINPECKKFESENVKVFIGSQEDEGFLNGLKQKIPKLDFLLDDGGHTMKQQIATFKVLFNHVADDGVYICEDLHTSYFKYFGGGLKKKRSFIEYSKNLIDKLHAWHTKDLEVDEFTKTTHSLHYYDSVLVIEKRKMSTPFDVKSGEASIQDAHAKDLIVKQNQK